MKNLIYLFILALVLLTTACSVETASQHDQRISEEFENISSVTETLQETSEIQNETETTLNNSVNVTSQTATATTSDVNKISVTVNIISNELSDTGTVFSYSFPVQVDEGSSAYVATKTACEQNSIAFSSKQTSISSYYIRAINNLWEKYPGYHSSGWVYKVNGTFASTTSNSYILKAGDTISWYYSLEYDHSDS